MKYKSFLLILLSLSGCRGKDDDCKNKYSIETDSTKVEGVYQNEVKVGKWTEINKRTQEKRELFYRQFSIEDSITHPSIEKYYYKDSLYLTVNYIYPEIPNDIAIANHELYKTHYLGRKRSEESLGTLLYNFNCGSCHVYLQVLPKEPFVDQMVDMYEHNQLGTVIYDGKYRNKTKGTNHPNIPQTRYHGSKSNY